MVGLVLVGQETRNVSSLVSRSVSGFVEYAGVADVRDQRPPEAQGHSISIPDLDTRRLLRTQILGGLVNEYRHAA